MKLIDRIALKAAAVAAGEAQYFTGKPCKRGHIAPRSTANSTCMECDREKYHQRSEQRIVQMREWREANPEIWKSACKRWREANPEAVRNHRFKRDRREQNGPGFTAAQADAIFEAQGRRCANCLKKLEKYHADHIVPLAAGGVHDIKNIQALCASCNCKKHKKDPFAWARENGRLL